MSNRPRKSVARRPNPKRRRAAAVLFMGGFDMRAVARLLRIRYVDVQWALRKTLMVAWILGFAAVAHAQITIPNTFVNNTPADATQVNANFAALGSNALNRTGGTMTGTLTSQAITPATDATYDLGTGTFRFRNLPLSGTLTLYSALAFNATNTIDLGAVGNVPRDVYYGRNAIGPAQFDAGNSGAAITINFATNGPIQKVTRTANCTYTLTAPPSAGYVTLVMVHDATANVYTVTFSPAAKYPGGATPTYTNTNGAVDIVTFYWSGASWFAVQLAAFA